MQLEPNQAVHKDWKADEAAVTWKLSCKRDYQSAGGVSMLELMSKSMMACWTSNNVVHRFVSIFPLKALNKITTESNNYANKDYVVPVLRQQRQCEGNEILPVSS